MSDLADTRRLAGVQPVAPPPRYEPGFLITGKYRLEAMVGEGGMASVWLARNVLLDVRVALKLMDPKIQTDETVERFFVEARIQAKLKHPNIVHVFDFGHTELGDPFIVMELLEGETLRDFMFERGRLNPAAAVQIMLPVIAALCHAHEHGVVHRDLKPENIFLDRSDVDVVPRLLDFGIAKLIAGPKRHVTQDGELLGSPAYMSPEQAQGLQDVDHRADVWAACVVLYEAITGKPAFPGEGYAVLRRVVEEALPPLPETGAGEAALSRILAMGLEKDPRFRTKSMRALGTALAQWLCNQGEIEDLYGHRISRSWRVMKAPAPNASQVRSATAHRARAGMPRVLLAAAIVLLGITLPSKLRVEAASAPGQLRRVGTAPLAAYTPPLHAAETTTVSALTELARRPEPRQLLTHSVATPAMPMSPAKQVAPQDSASERRERLKSMPPVSPPSGAELGLKEAY